MWLEGVAEGVAEGVVVGCWWQRSSQKWLGVLPRVALVVFDCCAGSLFLVGCELGCC